MIYDWHMGLDGFIKHERERFASILLYHYQSLLDRMASISSSR